MCTSWYAFIRRQPIKTIAALVGAGVFLAILNYQVKKTIAVDTPLWFPISMFEGPTLHGSGLVFASLFLLCCALAIKHHSKLNAFQVWVIAFFLILLGNLEQGNWDSAILKPFYESGMQYYHDAIRIDSGFAWLSSFNANQSALLVHSRAHPPFAVLVHYGLLRALGNNLSAVGLVFVLLSSLSVFIMWRIFVAFDVPRAQRNRLALLYSMIPAINIYCAVSLDGLILTSSSLFMLGIVLLDKEQKVTMTAVSFLLVGLIVTNMLTYGGVFLFGVVALYGLKEYVLRKKHTAIIVAGILVMAFMLCIYCAAALFGYNHIRGFITASALENPGGFRGFTVPMTYLMTRIENVCEIALFLSFGCLSVLFHPDTLGVSLLDWRRRDIGLTSTGVIVLAAMFIAGAFRTGETARACLFIYPYIMLAFMNTDSRTAKDLMIIACTQTACMQLIGNYFW